MDNKSYANNHYMVRLIETISIISSEPNKINKLKSPTIESYNRGINRTWRGLRELGLSNEEIIFSMLDWCRERLADEGTITLKYSPKNHEETKKCSECQESANGKSKK